MNWWYLSFASTTEFLGGVFVGPVKNLMEAVRLAHERGCNPGGEITGVRLEPEDVPPERFRFRLLDKAAIRDLDARMLRVELLYALDIDKLGPEITWYVSVGLDKYEVQAFSAQSAIRQALIVYLDVQQWDDESKGWWNILDLADILDALPESLDVYAVPDVDREVEVEVGVEPEEGGGGWTLN